MHHGIPHRDEDRGSHHRCRSVPVEGRWEDLAGRVGGRNQIAVASCTCQLFSRDVVDGENSASTLIVPFSTSPSSVIVPRVSTVQIWRALAFVTVW